jgi:hypothetical protein
MILPPGDESNIGVEDECPGCEYPWVKWEKKDPSLPANHLAANGKKDNLRMTFGQSSGFPNQAHWCGPCDIVNPVTGRKCGMHVQQVPGKPVRYTTQTIKSGGTGLKRHRCAGSEDNLHHRNDASYKEQHAAPSKTERDVAYIAKTGKDPDSLPAPIKNNPIFNVLEEEKKKTELRLPSTIGIGYEQKSPDTEEHQDKQWTDYKNKKSKAEFTTADKLLETVEPRELTLQEMHQELTGEAIDSLTKKLADTIARVDVLESLISPYHTKVIDIGQGLKTLKDDMLNIHTWIRQGSEL